MSIKVCTPGNRSAGGDTGGPNLIAAIQIATPAVSNAVSVMSTKGAESARRHTLRDGGNSIAGSSATTGPLPLRKEATALIATTALSSRHRPWLAIRSGSARTTTLGRRQRRAISMPSGTSTSGQSLPAWTSCGRCSTGSPWMSFVACQLPMADGRERTASSAISRASAVTVRSSTSSTADTRSCQVPAYARHLGSTISSGPDVDFRTCRSSAGPLGLSTIRSEAPDRFGEGATVAMPNRSSNSMKAR